MIKINRYMLTLLILLFSVADLFAEKSPYKVLIVGNAKYSESYLQLLQQYFSAVKLINAEKWHPEDSNEYDVTVFTSVPKPLGKVDLNNVMENQYLPDDFSKPVVFIGMTAPVMGKTMGLKLDWLCLCLHNHAHHLNTRHPIFDGPLVKVTPTLLKRKTPAGIYEYPSGDAVPKEIPMWGVANENFKSIGMVSRGDDFANSPDAEVISSGVCLKDVSAVALGRHGNFFLWGFTAPPADMTEEAKKVFVNVVAYMKQFDGQRPIVRKTNEFIATRESILDRANRCTEKWYLKMIKNRDEEQKIWEEKANSALKKKNAGENLTEEDKMAMLALGMAKQSNPWNTWDEFVKYTLGNNGFERFGSYGYKIKQYIEANLGYMTADSVGYDFHIDIDAQKLKISNHDPKILAKSIALLKKGEQTDLAKRILTRYTMENYATAEEWEHWFVENRTKLFFTEAGGWKFLVNTIKENKS